MKQINLLISLLLLSLVIVYGLSGTISSGQQSGTTSGSANIVVSDNIQILQHNDFNASTPYYSDYGNQYFEIKAKKDITIELDNPTNVDNGISFKSFKTRKTISKIINDYNKWSYNIPCVSIYDGICKIDKQKIPKEIKIRIKNSDLNVSKITQIGCTQTYTTLQNTIDQTKCRIDLKEIIGSHTELVEQLATTRSGYTFTIPAGETKKIWLDFAANKSGIFKYDLVFSIDGVKYVIDPYIVVSNLQGGDFNYTEVKGNTDYFNGWYDGNIGVIGELDWNTSKNYPADYDTNLIGYWKMDDNNGTHILDETSNNNDAEIMNQAHTEVIGLWDTNALYCDGVSLYDDLRVIDNDTLDITDEITIIASVKQDAVNLTNFKAYTDNALIAWKGSAYGIGFGVSNIGCASGVFCGAIYDGASWNVVNASGKPDSIYDKHWYRVAMVYDGTNMKLYINGNENNSTAYSGGINITGDNFYIGGYAETSPYQWMGVIDEVKLYDRALSSDEIMQDYNEWTSSYYVSPVIDANESVDWNAIMWYEDINYGGKETDANLDSSLVAYYTFDDEDSNSTHIFDITGNGYDMQKQNGADTTETGIWGKANTASLLDGVDDRFYLPSNNNPFNGLTDMTLSIWFNSTSTENTNPRIISNGALDDFEVAVNYSGGAVGGIPDGGVAMFIRDSSPSSWQFLGYAEKGKWHHLVITLGNTEGMYAYLDGTYTHYSGAAWVNGVDGIFYIGCRYTGDACNNAKVDEVRIYNRILTEQEIYQLYAQGRSNIRVQVRSCDDANCVGDAWVDEFDEGNVWHNLSVSDNRYLQWRAFFDLNDLFAYPYLGDVNISYIQSTKLPPDVNVVYPTESGLYFTDANTITIDMNVIDKDTNADGMLFSLRYSTTNVSGSGTAIITDGNVASTQGLYCDTNDLSSTTQCHYDWDVPADDGNYYILATIDDGTTTDFSTSTYSFKLDNTAPTTTSDINSGWQNVPANVQLTCDDGDGVGCWMTQYRIDTDQSDNISFGAWQTGNSFNISGDGNWAVDYNSSDKLGLIENTNREYVLISTVGPNITIQKPTDSSTTSDNLVLFDVNKSNGQDINVNSINVKINDVASSIFDPLTDCLLYDGNYSCSYNETGFIDGTNSIKINAYDTAGNPSNQASVTFTFFTPLPVGVQFLFTNSIKNTNILIEGSVTITKDVNLSSNRLLIDGNIMMKSPDGTWWSCGVDNNGTFSCS